MSDFTRIRLRRASSSGWLEADPLLALGEAGYETDTKKLKIGDGSGIWSALDYVKVDQSSIEFPDIQLGIYDGQDQRIGINLSNNEPLNIIGSGGTSILYNDYTKTLTVNSLSNGAAALTKNNILDALGYTPQISGSYSLSTHGHVVANISGLQDILDSKQTTGNYALSGHNHELSIGDGIYNTISYNIEDRLNIIGSGYTSVLFDNYTNSIIVYSSGNSGVVSLNNRVGNLTLNYADITGAIGYVPQPVGSYSLSSHNHYASGLLDLQNIFEQKTILSGNASGVTGQICWDSSYLYLCISTNLWHRIPHSSW
jgi:hypothetical protein